MREKNERLLNLVKPVLADLALVSQSAILYKTESHQSYLSSGSMAKVFPESQKNLRCATIKLHFSSKSRGQVNANRIA